MDNLVLIVIFIMAFFIFLLIEKVLNLMKELRNIKKNQKEFNKINEFFIKENERLKFQISILEEEEERNMENDSTIKKEKIKYNPIYKGKKVIVGNYDKWSAEQARKILRSFGLKVDVVKTGDDIIDRIQNGYKYDIIFTNNLYKNGKYINGKDVLNKLKDIEQFNIPVVVHTVSVGEREHFINDLKFNEYLEKPLKLDRVEEVLNKLLIN